MHFQNSTIKRNKDYPHLQYFDMMDQDPSYRQANYFLPPDPKSEQALS